MTDDATAWSAYDEGYLLYVFVHHLLDGRPPGVPIPDGLLERATPQGRPST